MREMAKEYELALVLRPELDEEHQQAVLGRYRQVIETHGGATEELNVWGKRRLAYEIKDYNEGIYFFVPFTADSTANTELDRLLRIDENVLRYLIVVRPRQNPPKPTTMPEATGAHGDGPRTGPVPAGERQGPGLPVRRSEVSVAAQEAQSAEAPQATSTEATQAEGAEAPQATSAEATQAESAEAAAETGEDATQE